MPERSEPLGPKRGIMNTTLLLCLRESSLFGLLPAHERQYPDQRLTLRTTMGTEGVGGANAGLELLEERGDAICTRRHCHSVT